MGHQCIASWYFTMLLHHISPWYCTMLQQNRIKQVILITCSILSNQRSRNVPHFVGHLIYVPHVPHLWDNCGTKTRSPQDGDKFTDFWIDLMKILLPPFF